MVINNPPIHNLNQLYKPLFYLNYGLKMLFDGFFKKG